MPDWATITGLITAICLGAAGIITARSTRRKNAGDYAESIASAAEKIVTMREADVQALSLKLAAAEKLVVDLRKEGLEHTARIEELQKKIQAREKDVEALRQRIIDIQKYIDYLHTWIARYRKKNAPASMDQFLQALAEGRQMA